MQICGEAHESNLDLSVSAFDNRLDAAMKKVRLPPNAASSSFGVGLAPEAGCFFVSAAIPHCCALTTWTNWLFAETAFLLELTLIKWISRLFMK